MSSETVSDQRLEEIRVQLIKGRQAITFEENLMMVWELQSLRSKPVASGVDELVDAARNASMYLRTGFIECDKCGHEVQTANTDAQYELDQALSALLPKATAPVVSEPVAWGVFLTNGRFMDIASDSRETAIEMAEVHYEPNQYEVRPFYASPQSQPKAVTEELDGADLQTLMQLKRDNVWDGARPVLENPIADEMRRAFALSERGLIALEQVARGVRLHITRKGVAALEAAMKEA